MKYKNVLVTPKMAKELLEKNTKNRRLDQRHVKKIALDMKNGFWEKDNPVSTLIVIDEDGVLKNGQHRLNAVIEANMSIPFTLCTGVSRNITHFDENKGRGIGNYLQINGKCKTLSHNSITGAAKLLMGEGDDLKIRTLSNANIASFIEKNAELFSEAHRICRLGAGNPICRNTVMLAAIYTALQKGESTKKLEDLCRIANTGFQKNENENIAIVVRNDLTSLETKDKFRSSTLIRWNTYGLFQEYIYLFCKGSTRKSKINKPTFHYSSMEEF